MDFVLRLPRTLRKYDVVLVIMVRLTKSTHFILVMTSYPSERLAQIYIGEIIRLKGVPIFIIYDWGMQFTSQFWIDMQHELGTQVKLSNVFHP